MNCKLIEYSNGKFDDINSIDLRQNDVSGGNCSKEDIDLISNYPNAKKIIISGLKQEVFDYFIDKLPSSKTLQQLIYSDKVWVTSLLIH
ncbi:hypothetical protein [Vallitalea sp.]|jgi:hypothetical protein|uniref:hypothetical protein n=1 Tax=Vallitalea sp. TaxID=1882829 RepID=UPI0025D9E728|nr:hypothetical protein [Vallitalea sp.]MCT4687014.1 hypothetical protein [Vallitalea sp.]